MAVGPTAKGDKNQQPGLWFVCGAIPAFTRFCAGNVHDAAVSPQRAQSSHLYPGGLLPRGASGPPLARWQFPQAMDHPGRRGPGQWSFGSSHCAGVEPRVLCAFPVPASVFAVKGIGSSPNRPSGLKIMAYSMYYCRLSLVNYCRNRKPVFLKG